MPAYLGAAVRKCHHVKVGVPLHDEWTWVCLADIKWYDVVCQVLDETAKMLKRHKQRFLGNLHVDQQKLRAQLEVLRSDVEAFAELGDIAQVGKACLTETWLADAVTDRCSCCL